MNNTTSKNASGQEQIIPLQGQVYLGIESLTAGVLDTSSRATAVEYAEVLAIGEGVPNLKVGDKVFVKAWAVDNIVHNDKKYYFCHIDTHGIIAIVK